MEGIIALTIPIFLCVVLPVSIVALVMNASKNKDNQRAKIMLAYIEKSDNADIDKMKDILPEHKKTLRERALSNLKGGLICIGIGIALLITPLFEKSTWYGPISTTTGGGILLAIGIALVAMYFVTKKAADRSEAEKRLKEEESDIIDC